MTRGHWLLVRSFLMRHKLRNGLLGVVIAASAMLFVTSLGVISGVDQPFETMFRSQAGSHITLMFDSRIHDPDEVVRWWSQREGVEGVQGPLSFVLTEDTVVVDGRDLGTQLWLAEVPLHGLSQDRPLVVSGGEQSAPGPGEIWFPSSLATSQGIQVGDDLTLPVPAGTVTLRVSAVVIDPQFGSVFFNPTRAWVRGGSLPNLFPASRLDGCLVGVRLGDSGQVDAHWQAFTDHLGGAFSGSPVFYSTVRAAWLGTSQMIGSLLLGFSLLSLLVALFIISTTVSSSILADTRLFGVLEAQGFTAGDLRRIYLVTTLALTAVFVPIGLAFGRLTVAAAMTYLLAAMGLVDSSAPFSLHALVTFGVMATAIGAAVVFATRKVSRIRPAEAIRFGGSVKTATGWRPAMRFASRLPVSLNLALRMLLVPRQRALLTVFGMAATSFALLFALNIVNSFANMGDNLGNWGFDGAEVRVMRSGKRSMLTHEELQAHLLEQPGVRVARPMAMLVEGAVPARNGLVSRSLFGTSVEGDLSTIGFQTLSGRSPRDSTEVSLAINTARDYGVSVGDPFELFLLGQPIEFRICGIYQSFSNMGQGFRIQSSVLTAMDPLFEPPMVGLVLEPGTDREALIRQLEADLGEAVDAQVGDLFVADTIAALTGAMSAAFAFVALLFLLVSFAAVFTNTRMDVQEQRQVFGILKTVGLTPGQLRAVQAQKAGILAFAGVALGAALWALLTPALLSGLFSDIGLASFPLTIHLLGSLLVVSAVIFLCSFAAWLSANGIARIGVRALVTE